MGEPSALRFRGPLGYCGRRSVGGSALSKIESPEDEVRAGSMSSLALGGCASFSVVVGYGVGGRCRVVRK